MLPRRDHPDCPSRHVTTRTPEPVDVTLPPVRITPAFPPLFRRGTLREKGLNCATYLGLNQAVPHFVFVGLHNQEQGFVASMSFIKFIKSIKFLYCAKRYVSKSLLAHKFTKYVRPPPRSRRSWIPHVGSPCNFTFKVIKLRRFPPTSDILLNNQFRNALPNRIKDKKEQPFCIFH